MFIMIVYICQLMTISATQVPENWKYPVILKSFIIVFKRMLGM